jgi:zinc transport system substrate-binding protein
MNGRLIRVVCAVCLGPATLCGCSGAPKDRSADSVLTVFAGIQPIAYLVERIGGGHADVHTLLPPGGDPHTFELSPRQAAALGASKLFFKVGMPFEDLLVQRIAENPQRPEIVDVGEGIAKRRMDAEARHESQKTASVSPQHYDESGETLDPHVWLSPPLLKIQASNVAKAFVRIDPEHARDYERNLAALLNDIQTVDDEIKSLLGPLRGQAFLVYHPAFGYFADAYGLKQAAVEEEGKSPTPRRLQALIEQARAAKIRVVFVQPQFDPHGAETIAQAIGAKVAVIDDLAKDVLANLLEIAGKIQQAGQAQLTK